MSLRKSVFTAIRWNVLSSVASVAIRFCSIAILARLLEPEDYGLVAMSGVVMGFASLFQDLGINSAFIQAQNVSRDQRSSLFWLNVAMSAAMALLVIMLSPALGWFFGDPRLVPLMMLSSTSFIFAALGAQIRMAAQKELNFQPLVLTDIAASLLKLIVAIMLALSGWGVYSLVLSGILFSIALTSMSWLFMAGGWSPSLRLKYDDVKSFISFGSAVVADKLTNNLNRTIDIFLGGKLLGAASLGYYSVPKNWVFDLNFLVNPIITQVGFPLIAKIQSDIVRVRRVYLKTVNMTASVNAPLYIGLAFFAPDFVAVVLGPGWEFSGELLRILAIYGGIRSTLNPVGSLLYGMGQAGLAAKWNTGLLVIVPLTIWIGAQRGAEGMAYALLTVQVVLFVPAWFFLVRKTCRASFGEYSAAILTPFLLAGLSIAPAYWISAVFEMPLFRLAVGVMIAAPVYAGLSFLANREWVVAMLELIGRESGQSTDSSTSS